jgi:hypothetical protein
MSIAAAVAVRATAEVQRMTRAVAPETNGRPEVAQTNNNNVSQTSANMQQMTAQAVARVMPGAVTAMMSSEKPGTAKLTYSRAQAKEKERRERDDEPQEKEVPGDGKVKRGLAAYRRNG